MNLETKECPLCGAKWLNGKHYWRTGKEGDEKSLSNLVCGLKESPQCINPSHKKGHVYGEADTWEKRRSFIDSWKPEWFVMPRGQLTKVDVESKVLRLYLKLDEENVLPECKLLAQNYLLKVLDVLEEYRY